MVKSVEMEAMSETLGQDMHDFIRGLFPICRSLTGRGTRETLSVIRQHLPDLMIHEVPSGTQVFDWVVPDEWNITSARLIDPSGKTIIDFADNNLHVVGYSEPVNQRIDLADLQNHLYSLPDQPDAIPYVTSYYKRRWGFCLTDHERQKLQPGIYDVQIDSTLEPGSLTYGELVLPGESSEEVFISTYVCHPSMANNELSGPAVATWLAKWLSQAQRKFTYRLVFIPETIGSICYISKNLDALRKNVVAGFNISCVGDDRCYSFLPSRNGNTISDRVAVHALKYHAPDYVTYSFLDRGSDERQYCSPGVDLPIASIMRSKYGCYPEYHTSLDDLDLVTPSGLYGAYSVLRRALELIDANAVWRATTLCEPQLGKRGLYPTVSTARGAYSLRGMMNLLAYADGTRDLIELADVIGENAYECLSILDNLERHGLVERVEKSQADSERFA
jgi:aminopeptidase-like protein